MSLLGVKTNRDGTLAFNKNTFQNIICKLNVVTAFFTDSITTDNSSVSVAGLSKDTKPGTYALAKSGSDYTLERHTYSKWQ